MTSETRRVASAAGLLAGSVLVARVLGLVRDGMLGAVVGRGPATDAYFAAFMIPDILGYLLAGLLIGPHFAQPLVKNHETVHTLSELGVILLIL